MLLLLLPPLTASSALLIAADAAEWSVRILSMIQPSNDPNLEVPERFSHQPMR
jgi:hypothetical protein